jgi:putative aldouronate transport system substrate-binding protein
MKRFNKATTLMLATMMSVLALGGCTTKKDAPKEPAVQSGTPKQGEISWKKDTAPHEIDWFINFGYSYKWDSQAAVHKKILEDTGISIKFTAAVGSANEQLNTMIASNSLPSVVTLYQNAPQYQQLQGNGMLLPINKLSEQHAPDLINKRLPKSLKDWWKFNDGNLYGVPNFFWAEEWMTKDNFIETNTAMFARKDIMDQLGIKAEDFSTTAGTIAALKKVKDAKVQYNGKLVDPLWFSENGGAEFTIPTALASFFGVPRETKDGKWQDHRMHPKFNEVIAFTNTLYREGLLAKESFTGTRAQLREKYQSGALFSYLGNFTDVNGQAVALAKADPKAVSVAVGPIKSKDGSKPMLGSTSRTGWTMTSITKNAKKPERIVAFFDYMMTEEANIMNDFGIEGEHHVKGGANGSLKWSDSYLEARTKDNTAARQKTGVNTLYWLGNPALVQRMSPLPQNEQDLMARNIQLYFGKFAYGDTAWGGLTVPGGTDLAAVNTELETYWRRELIKAVLEPSEEKAIATYENIKKEMYKSGYDKIEKVVDELYQANKKKMGVDKAWTGDQK